MGLGCNVLRSVCCKLCIDAQAESRRYCRFFPKTGSIEHKTKGKATEDVRKNGELSAKLQSHCGDTIMQDISISDKI